MNLHCPLIPDDPAFAAGVEFGIFFAHLHADRPNYFADTFFVSNRERVLTLLARSGYQATALADSRGPWCFVSARRQD